MGKLELKLLTYIEVSLFAIFLRFVTMLRVRFSVRIKINKLQVRKSVSSKWRHSTFDPEQSASPSQHERGMLTL